MLEAEIEKNQSTIKSYETTKKELLNNIKQLNKIVEKYEQIVEVTKKNVELTIESVNIPPKINETLTNSVISKEELETIKSNFIDEVNINPLLR